MKAKHVYMKGRNGWGLFYRVEDCLVFFTVYSVLIREMGLCVLAFSIMFNHIHSLFKDIPESVLKKYQIRLATIFSREYNTEYDRTGPVFKRRFGRAGKHAMKKIIACIAYIFNNPVAGKLCRLAIQNRWTLLAYKDNPNPFSLKLVKRRSRHIVRDALKVVDIYYREGKYLGYATLKRIFSGLTPEEKQQVIDYIVYKYNFLNYDELEEIFGSFAKALDVVENIAGNEYDLEDDCGDHSVYNKLIKHSRVIGYEGPNFDMLPPELITKISRMLYVKVNPSADQMRKFLHLPDPSETLRKPAHSPVPR
jgi:hypothetical protein